MWDRAPAEIDMIADGTIVGIDGDRTVVELAQTAHCGRCSAFLCVTCQQPRIEVSTVPGPSVGDRVKIEVPISRFTAILAVFGLPLIAVLVGALFGNFLTERWFPDTPYPNLFPIVLAVALVVLTFAGVYVYERKSSDRKKQPFILRSG